MAKMFCSFTAMPLRFALALTVIVALTVPSLAREISSDEAGRAAATWVRRDRTPLGATLASADVAEVRTAKKGDTPLFHIVRMSGGGVVVTSAESGVTPIVAVLDGDNIDEAVGNPLWEILRADMANRLARVEAVRANAQGATPLRSKRALSAASATIFATEEAAWAELLGESGRKQSAAIPDASGISDLRVPAILTSSWNQSGGAANYYTPLGPFGTPTNFPCGCVALVGAQIARHWRFPTDSVPQVVRECWVSGVPGDCQSMGGIYDWTNMPDDFSALTLVQRQAVGKLCYDFGVGTRMNWGPEESGGSGTVSTMLAEAFRDVFGYTNAMAYTHFGGSVIPDDLVEKAVLANLDAGCPVAVSLAGHSVVADGYGYSADAALYTHLNFGWSGAADAWYNLPDVDDSAGTGYTSSILEQVVYNVFPEKSGELLTGRVLDSNGDPVSGATVTVTSGSTTATGTTNERGIYAFLVSGGRPWTVTATDGNDTGSLTVMVGASESAVFTRTAQGSSSSYPGVIGNSWGNDVTLGVDVPADGIFFVDEATGNDANDGRSWATSKASIQAAVDASSADDIVVVADGRYEPISTANKAITIQSLNGPETTFIDGSLQWARGVTNRCAMLVGIKTNETDTVLVGFTLVNGMPPNTNDTSYVLSSGGGSLGGTLRDCVLTNNVAKNGGGACRSILENCMVSGNVAKFGGGTYHGSLADCTVAENSSTSSGGGIYALSDTVVTNCTISGNWGGTYGGGVYAYAKSSLIGCTITNNAAGSSGGGCNGGTLSDCLIAGNTATTMGGGTYTATALTRCTVTNNVAGTYGGGCYKGTLSFCIVTGNRAGKSGGGTSGAVLTDCTVAGNTATESGGGVESGSATRCGIVGNTATTKNGGGSSGAVLDNCIVVHNESGADGGGAASGALTNCTIYANKAVDNGGGVYLASLANCIVWGNTAPQNPAVYASSSKPCLSSCLDQTLTGNHHVGNIVTNPLFVSESDWHLQAGSPCINAGTNDLAVGEIDFYGNARIAGGTVDMGASEYQPPGGYAAWAALNGLGGPDEVTDGQPNLIRYAFNVPRGAFSPFTGISFNAGGKPVVTLLPLVNTDGVTVKVLSTTDLTDWTDAEVKTLTIDDNGTLIFDHESDPQRFYRLKAE
ncbi:MAG: C10 family peptidase [Kiritimatiellae bacterium]|nr:C10 family peptidase [Kiritimatiellia bacterium]